MWIAWKRREVRTGFCSVNLTERGHSEDLGVDGMIILSETVGMDWIEQAQDRNRWRAFVNAVINFRAPQNEGNVLTVSGRISLSRMTLLGELVKTLWKRINARRKRNYQLFLIEHILLCVY